MIRRIESCRSFSKDSFILHFIHSNLLEEILCFSLDTIKQTQILRDPMDMPFQSFVFPIPVFLQSYESKRPSDYIYMLKLMHIYRLSNPMLRLHIPKQTSCRVRRLREAPYIKHKNRIAQPSRTRCWQQFGRIK